MTKPNSTSPQSPAPRLRRRDWVKLVLMLLVVGVGLTLVYASPLREYIGHIRELKQRLAELGLVGPLVYMAAVLVLVSLGFPRLLFCPIGGMAFGVGYGLLWTQLPTLLGCYLSFLFVRWGGRAVVLRHWPGMGRLVGKLQHRSVVAVFLMRQVPLPGAFMNLLLGMSPIRHRDFLLGTALGLFPQAIPMTMFGKSLLQVWTLQTWLILGGALLLFVGVMLLSRYLAQHIPWLQALLETVGAARRKKAVKEDEAT